KFASIQRDVAQGLPSKADAQTVALLLDKGLIPIEVLLRLRQPAPVPGKITQFARRQRISVLGADALRKGQAAPQALLCLVILATLQSHDAQAIPGCDDAALVADTLTVGELVPEGLRGAGEVAPRPGLVPVVGRGARGRRAIREVQADPVG